jgi:hypothetical protein
MLSKLKKNITNMKNHTTSDIFKKGNNVSDE